MRKDEVVKKNIGLTFDFIRAAVADPHLLDKIPDGAEIEFLETDLPRIETEERANLERTELPLPRKGASSHRPHGRGYGNAIQRGRGYQT